MLKVYMMPNGRKYRFADEDVPAGAVQVYPKPKKTAKKSSAKSNKAKTPSNKAKKVANK